MTRFARLLLEGLAAVGLVVLLAMLARLRDRPDRATQTSGGASADRAEAAPGESDAAGRDPARPHVVIDGEPRPAVAPEAPPARLLPDNGAPLARHFDDLAERARAGDVAAARRLYMDVSSCRIQLGNTAVTQGNKPPRRERFPVEADFHHWLQSWRRTALRECARARQCEGVSSVQLERPDQWLLRAAELGDRRAQVSFAQGDVFARAQSLDSYELLDRWRQHALPWLEQAVAAGDAGALLALGSALSVSREQWRVPLLAQISPDDPARGYAFLHALSLSASVGGDSTVQAALAAAGERLDVSQRLRARTVGTDLYHQHRRTLDSAIPDLLKPLVDNTLPRDEAQLIARAPGCAAQVDALYQQTLHSAPAPVATPGASR